MISKDEVLKLAELARLKLAAGEAESLQRDISSVLDYVSQVSAVEVTAGREVPANHTVMREDMPSAVLGERESLLEAFPKREGDHNVVRKIIQKDE